MSSNKENIKLITTIDPTDNTKKKIVFSDLGLYPTEDYGNDFGQNAHYDNHQILTKKNGNKSQIKHIKTPNSYNSLPNYTAGQKIFNTNFERLDYKSTAGYNGYITRGVALGKNLLELNLAFPIIVPVDQTQYRDKDSVFILSFNNSRFYRFSFTTNIISEVTTLKISWSLDSHFYPETSYDIITNFTVSNSLNNSYAILNFVKKRGFVYITICPAQIDIDTEDIIFNYNDSIVQNKTNYITFTDSSNQPFIEFWNSKGNYLLDSIENNIFIGTYDTRWSTNPSIAFPIFYNTNNFNEYLDNRFEEVTFQFNAQNLTYTESSPFRYKVSWSDNSNAKLNPGIYINRYDSLKDIISVTRVKAVHPTYNTSTLTLEETSDHKFKIKEKLFKGDVISFSIDLGSLKVEKTDSNYPNGKYYLCACDEAAIIEFDSSCNSQTVSHVYYEHVSKADGYPYDNNYSYLSWDLSGYNNKDINNYLDFSSRLIQRIDINNIVLSKNNVYNVNIKQKEWVKYDICNLFVLCKYGSMSTDVTAHISATGDFAKWHIDDAVRYNFTTNEYYLNSLYLKETPDQTIDQGSLRVLHTLQYYPTQYIKVEECITSGNNNTWTSTEGGWNPGVIPNSNGYWRKTVGTQSIPGNTDWWLDSLVLSTLNYNQYQKARTNQSPENAKTIYIYENQGGNQNIPGQPAGFPSDNSYKWGILCSSNNYTSTPEGSCDYIGRYRWFTVENGNGGTPWFSYLIGGVSLYSISGLYPTPTPGSLSWNEKWIGDKEGRNDYVLAYDSYAYNQFNVTDPSLSLKITVNGYWNESVNAETTAILNIGSSGQELINITRSGINLNLLAYRDNNNIYITCYVETDPLLHQRVTCPYHITKIEQYY